MKASTADLVALHLARAPSVKSEGTAPRAASIPGIGAALEIGVDAMADRIELLSALSTLKEQGHVVEHTRAVEGFDGERNVYALTEAGREHAAALRSRLRDERVTVRDEDREWTVPLAEVDQYLDPPALVRALSRLSEDGVLYLDRGEGRRFVDRRGPLSALLGALSATTAGEGRAVLVAGEAGVGKTTLVAELLDTAREADCRVLEGVCRRDEADPYHPFRTALDGVTPDAASSSADAPVPDLAAGAADLGFDLDVDTGETAADPFDRSGLALIETDADADDLAAQRRVLFADVVDRLRRLAADRPVVLFVDDLHSADEATLELFDHVAGEVADVPVLLVGTFRHEDLPTRHPLTDLADDWPGAPPVPGVQDPHDVSPPVDADPDTTPERFTVDLAPFDREVTATLVRRLLDDDPPAAFVDAVSERTGGNPLFVTETVARLRETGDVDPAVEVYPESPDAMPLPDRVEEAVDVRLGVLDERSRRVLETGALVGETVPYEVLSAAVDVPEPELRDYVDLLVDSRVWERAVADGGRPLGRRAPDDADPDFDFDRERLSLEDPDDPDDGGSGDGGGDTDTGGEWLRFSSGLVRETVVDRVPAERARALHERIADAYVAVHGESARPGAVAHHYREADRPADALEWYLRAGDRAREVYAHEVARDQYDTALALARELDDQVTELSIVEQLGRVDRVLGEADRADERFEYVREHTDDDETRARIARLQSRMEARRGAYEQAIHHADRGLAILDDGGHVERVRLRSNKGWAHVQRGEFDEARPVLEEAVTVAEDLADDAALGRALHTLATLEMSQHGADEAAIDTMRRAVELRERAGDRSGVASSLNNLGGMYLRAGELAAAREAFEQCLAINESVGDAHGVVTVRNNLGKVHEARDEPDRALEYYRRVREDAREMGARQTLANALANAASVHQEYRYDLDTARERLERSLELQRDLDNTRWKINANLDLAQVRTAQGDLEAGLSHAERAVSLAHEAGMDSRLCTAARFAGDVSTERGDYEHARDRHETALEKALEYEEYPDKEAHTRASFVDTLVGLDEVAAAREQAAAAHDTLERVRETYDERYAGRLTAYVDLARGTAHRAAGEYDRAATHMDDALDRAQTLSMRQYAATIRYERGRLALARGDRETGLRRLREARAAAADLNFALLVGKCNERIAAVENESDPQADDASPGA